jgi:hypothetical protein
VSVKVAEAIVHLKEFPFCKSRVDARFVTLNSRLTFASDTKLAMSEQEEASWRESVQATAGAASTTGWSSKFQYYRLDKHIPVQQVGQANASTTGCSNTCVIVIGRFMLLLHD